MRRIVPVGILSVVVPGVWVLAANLKPAAPVVEAAAVWPGTVQRGTMLRQERGLGTLVAEDLVFVAAVTDGRVDRILVRPGSVVQAGTVILTLTNQELEQQTLDADFAVRMAEARLRDLRVQLASQTLTQRAELARLETELGQARLTYELKETMFKEGLERPLPYKIARAAFEDLQKRFELDKERLAIRKDSVEAQLAVQQAEIDKLKAMYQLRRNQLEALKVRAGVDGVLQDLPGPAANTTLQVGQRVVTGTILAKVAQPSKLKAELKIPETRIPEIKLNQRAEIDTRNGIIPGRVVRIDPAAKEGTVVVDVQLLGPLPPGARPDLSVDGVIEIEKLNNVLFVNRPAFGQPNSTVSMFKYDQDQKGARRVQVRLGRHSVNTIEILSGLGVGDKVILSDMSAWDAYDRIRLQ